MVIIDGKSSKKQMVIDGDLTSKHGAIKGISKLKRLGLDCSWGAGLGLFS